MSEEPLFTPKNAWFAAAAGATAALVVLSFIGGFLLLPYAETNAKLAGVWDAICSAAGVPRATVTSEQPKPDHATSAVVMDPLLFGPTDTRAVGRGGTLALQCAICHGSNRIGQIDTPNLEGQPAAAVYKQLRDFKAGVRSNAVMGPFAVRLNEQEMLDVASYYAYLPRQPGSHPDATVAAPAIVTHGAAMRNVPACGACHGTRDAKLGAPWLDGQSAVYIKAQLQAFASGARRNDISEQMRNIARSMTPDEIDAAARYYAARP